MDENEWGSDEQISQDRNGISSNQWVIEWSVSDGM